jgi:Asp-tRNA(Asn)/Glu-tRNA(Gln) amidotransferase A subunit family amidase
MTDFTRIGAAEAARQIRAGKLTSEKLVTACLERIGVRDTEVRAWAFCDPELALRQARALDRAQGARGPLHGVPVGFKDVFDTADMPTEYGSPIYAGHRPRWDAACVALTRAAGGVVLGKTATTEFANDHPAPTRNPHNLAHTPGGSSSGSAAAVADCMVPLAFGTQTGGSTIRPAAYCGIVGYKPTFNLVNRAGLKFVAESLDTIGLYGRTVEDVALLAHAVSGQDMPALERKPAGVPRIGLHRTARWQDADAAAQSALEAAARRLSAAGAAVHDVEFDQDFAALYDMQTVIMHYESARALAYENGHHRALISGSLGRRLESGMKTPRRDYEAAMAHARACRYRFREMLSGVDILLTLSAPGEAPQGLATTGSSLFNRNWTLLGAPCVQVPCATGANGLPLGVQVVGAIGHDLTALAWADWIHGVLRA